MFATPTTGAVTSGSWFSVCQNCRCAIRRNNDGTWYHRTTDAWRCDK